MRAIGKITFGIEAETGEVGGKRAEGDYSFNITGMTAQMNTDVALLKDAAAQVVGLGGITTVKFLHIKAKFPDTEVAPTIELLVSDGSGDKTLTGDEFVLLNTDITSIKLTNNSNDSSGTTATVLIHLGGV
jgi:hypothetical protein